MTHRHGLVRFLLLLTLSVMIVVVVSACGIVSAK